IVEILTSPGHTPSRDWLQFVKSGRARNKIKHWLNVHQRERAIEIGRKLIEKEARKYRVALKDIKDEEFARVAQDYGLSATPDLMAGIGYGKFSARQVLGRVAPQGAIDGTPQPGGAIDSGLTGVIKRVFGGGDNGAITVRGHGDLMVYRARCCNPIRGEQIVGYITRGKGVAVHSTSCPNVTNLLYEPERRIEVNWATKKDEKLSKPGTYPVKITVYCDDRAGLLKNLTAVISDDNTNIRNLDVRTGEAQAHIDVVVDIEDVKHLERITQDLRKVAGVREVQRVQKL
ncbi:MAG TPA: ACT domain-containing protein, partial [Terriglobales bacterium]|nr:ACT domain-containing protein [Terriglobales bacterium]